MSYLLYCAFKQFIYEVKKQSQKETIKEQNFNKYLQKKAVYQSLGFAINVFLYNLHSTYCHVLVSI